MTFVIILFYVWLYPCVSAHMHIEARDKCWCFPPWLLYVSTRIKSTHHYYPAFFFKKKNMSAKDVNEDPHGYKVSSICTKKAISSAPPFLYF